MKIPCPDEEKLAGYLEGRLSEAEKSQMEEHLSDCQICLEGLVVTNGLVRCKGLHDLDPVPAEVTEATVNLVTSNFAISHRSTMERLKGSIRNLGSRILDVLWLNPLGKWRLAPIRGSKRVESEDIVRLRVPFKDINMEIEIEKAGAGKARICVSLHGSNKPRKGVRITLKKGEREIASYLLDGAYVLFKDIPFGHYGISLAEDGVSLGTYLFEIKDTCHDRR